MFNLTSSQQVFLVLGATDMRKSIKGLCITVANGLGMDVLGGNVFVFCNKRQNLVKVLYWERNGFCLWQKCLEKHRFSWPKSEQDVLELDAQKLRWILDGLNFNLIQTQGHPTLEYKNII